MRLSLILLFPFGACASGQGPTFGVVAGTNLTDDTRSERFSYGGVGPAGETTLNTSVFTGGGRSFIIGLKVEQRLNASWAVEFNALHRELKSSDTTLISPPVEFSNGVKVSQFGPFARTLTTWEFPLLVKYRLPLPLHPFAAAGPSFRPAGTGTGLSHVGFSAGGGLELRAAGFRIEPELRYTRWSSANQNAFGAALLNQVEFLVGLDRPSTTLGINAFGKRLSIGGIVGIGLGDDFRAPNLDPLGRRPESNSGIYGIAIEAALNNSLALEVDGLYRPLHGSQNEFNRPVRFAHLTWEFPVLLKYRTRPIGRLRPFVEGGPSFRAEGNLNLPSVSHFGGTAGVGAEARLGWLKVSPMLRYTRWSGGESGNRAQSLANQTQLLFSFAF